MKDNFADEIIKCATCGMDFKWHRADQIVAYKEGKPRPVDCEDCRVDMRGIKRKGVKLK